jgi:hypothetical protein
MERFDKTRFNINNQFNMFELIEKICDELNEMETQEFDNNEKIVAV